MTNLEDELALRNLMARYVDAVNRYDADAWIATWAEDGVWNLLGNPRRRPRGHIRPLAADDGDLRICPSVPELLLV